MSLKDQIKLKLFEIYPREMSSGEIERFAVELGYNGETGRKRAADLRDEGFIATEVRAVLLERSGHKQDVAFHKAVPEMAKDIFKPKYAYSWSEEKQAMVEQEISTIPDNFKPREILTLL